MFQVRAIDFQRFCSLAVSLITWGICVATGQAQFHQTQPNPGAPLVPNHVQSNPLQSNQFLSIPFPPSSGSPSSVATAVSNQDGMRSDSTVSDVRSLVNSPNNSQFATLPLDYYSASVPTSGTRESQQGPGLPPLPNRSDGSQDPSQADWRRSINPLLNPPQNPTTPNNSPLFSQPTGFNPSASFLQQQGGEITGTGSRLLTGDQPTRQRSNQSMAELQSAITNQFDPYLNLQTNDAGVRRGRIPSSGQDGFQEYSLESGDRTLSETPGIPTRLVKNNEQLPKGAEETPTPPVSKSEASMDALSWWLMMCSVMANLILFYFLYDSRAKYLNLADELQSRFFREG